MKNNFEIVFPLLIQSEGTGYTNTPGDNGGPTKYGITIKDVQLYVKKNATAQDVRNLTLDQAKSIYKSKYWDTLGCDGLSSGVDYTCFDYGVNSGLGRPRKALQKFKSLTGTKLIDAINDERLAFLQSIGVGHNAQFLKGWTSRVSRVRDYSKTLAKQNNIAGPIVGSATVATGSLVSQYWHNHQILIIVGAIALAIGVGTAIHYFINKGKQ